MSRLSRRWYLALVIVLAVIVPHAAWTGRGPTVFAIGPRAQLGWQAGATISATGGTIYDATFLDASNGWAVGSNGGLYHTTDGGSTWITIVTGLPDDLYHVVFPDAQDGYALGANIILHTADGGATWQRLSSATMPNTLGYVSVPSPSMLAVYATPNNGQDGVYISTNSGISWTLNLQAEQINQIVFTSPSSGWFLGTDVVSRTTDGGATWQTVFGPGGSVTNIYQQIQFVSPSLGILLDNTKEVLRTTDGGASWQVIGSLPSPGGDYSLSGPVRMAFSSSSPMAGLIGLLANNYFSSPGNFVYITADGGVTWQPTFLGYPSNRSSGQPPIIGYRGASPYAISGNTFYYYGYPATPTPQPTSTATNTPPPTDTPTPTMTPWPTWTAMPSATPRPTATLRPATSTALPPTSTAIPLPSVPSDTVTPMPTDTPTEQAASTTGQRRAVSCHGSGLQQVVSCVQSSVLRIDVSLPDGAAEGTGFVVQSDSGGTYILTNRHVIEGASTANIRVIAPNGKTNYRVLGIAVNGARSGTAGDLAIVRVAPSSLRPLAFTRSALSVGQTVASIGYGLAFQLAGPPSVTEGIISALNRDLGDGYGPIWIQHQSTINHGNSGGPLLNLSGQVVGVNTLSIDQLPGVNGNEPVQGIFFAIPATMAHDVSQKLIAQFRSSPATTLRATTSRASQVTTSLYSVTAPAGWIVGHIAKDRPYLISRDGQVQIQFQTASVGKRPDNAHLRGMIARLAHALGHTRTLTFSSTTIGSLRGVSGTARYTNKTYRVAISAVTDPSGKHVIIAATVFQPNATASDATQASKIMGSLVVATPGHNTLKEAEGKKHEHLTDPKVAVFDISTHSSPASWSSATSIVGCMELGCAPCHRVSR